MARAEDLDVLLNTLVEDIADATDFERIVVLYHDQETKTLEAKVFYGFEELTDKTIFAFEEIGGLLNKVYADRQPYHVIELEQVEGGGPQALKYGVIKDYYSEKTPNKRQPINLCIKNISSTHVRIPHQTKYTHCTVFSVRQKDGPIESIFGRTTSYLIVPICESENFYGFLMADNGISRSPVTYGDARLSAAMVTHAASAIGRAIRQAKMLNHIAAQHDALKKAHMALEQHLEKAEHLKSFYESIIQNLRSGLITTDDKLHITHVNRSAEQCLGYKRDELIGQPLSIILLEEQRAKRCLFRDFAEELDQDAGYLAEMSMVCKDGTVIPTESCFSVITDARGVITGLSCIFRDITAKKAMEAHLARIDRLASLGELAAGVAHEIKNPLAGIAGAMQIMAREFGEDPATNDIFQEIFSQIKRLDGFVNNLLQFAKPSVPKFRMVRLDEILNSALFLASRQLQDKFIKIELNYGKDQPEIHGDQGLLQQVFLNIILNAVDAMENDGTLEIHICWDEKGKQCAKSECISSYSRIKSGVKVVIKDDGHGIPQDKLNSIFNPFFTTKPHGTGLGLSISHRIIEQHNGAIFVESTPDQGATFTVCLPLAQEINGAACPGNVSLS